MLYDHCIITKNISFPYNIGSQNRLFTTVKHANMISKTQSLKGIENPRN